MRTMAIVQARVTSSRMPGKVLAPLAGKPMILRQLERIARARTLDSIVVATSTDRSDDPLVTVLHEARQNVVRGDLDDVLSRFIVAMDLFNPEVVVRLTGDCPLASPTVIDRVVTSFYDLDADYVSNTMQPTYPDGLDVEVVRADVLRRVAQEATDPPEREHVTLGVYRRQELFRIENVANDEDLSALRWTVDSPEDYAFVSSIYDSLFETNPYFDVPDLLNLLTHRPDLSRTSADSPRNSALRGLYTGAMDA